MLAGLRQNWAALDHSWSELNMLTKFEMILTKPSLGKVGDFGMSAPAFRQIFAEFGGPARVDRSIIAPVSSAGVQSWQSFQSVCAEAGTAKSSSCALIQYFAAACAALPGRVFCGPCIDTSTRWG